MNGTRTIAVGGRHAADASGLYGRPAIFNNINQQGLQFTGAAFLIVLKRYDIAISVDDGKRKGCGATTTW